MSLENRPDSTTGASETSHRLPRLWPFLLVLASAAICLDLSTIHQYHASDSLLPVLVSLQHWTPFFWLQDRVGMLVPLLAIPFRHPLANLLVQDGLYIFSGLTAFLLLARYMLPNQAYALVGIGSASVFVALAPPGWCFNLFINTFYGVWLALGLAALVLLEVPSSGRVTWIKLAGTLTLLVLSPLGLHGNRPLARSAGRLSCSFRRPSAIGAGHSAARGAGTAGGR